MKKIEINCSDHPILTRYMFDLWLWLDKQPFNKQIDSINSRVYDSYGLIDTLGFNADKNKYTYSYNDEMNSIYGFTFLVLDISILS
jgi:hypothetical protein